MASDNISKLRLYNDIWNPEGMTNENSLANALLIQPDLLSPVLTHLQGREDKRFPLSFLTEGLGNTKYVDGIEYDYPVMGRLNKAVQLIAVKGTGIGHSKFKAEFKEKWFNTQYMIMAVDGTTARIFGEPVEGDNGGWEYTLQLDTTLASDTLGSTAGVGTMWVQLYAPVAPYASRGTESNSVAPSKMRNQITHIRKSYRYEGNMTNRVVNIQLPMGGKTTNLWYDFEEWQHMLRWREEVESMLWYSKYNRDTNGLIHMKDENGNPIPIGSGVMEQIPNYDQYGELSASKLKSVVRDALYGATDSQNMNIVLFTGLGGLEEFDNAMKAELNANTYIKNTDPKWFVSGGSKSLSLGGFFTSYEHIDGHKITVRHLPLLDYGARAMASNPHPKTGLPLESYRMLFVDMSTYDGEPNVYHVTQKGREMVRWAVAGATIPKGFSGNDLRASDVDAASVHFLKVGGVAIRRATNCMHLECVLS